MAELDVGSIVLRIRADAAGVQEGLSQLEAAMGQTQAKVQQSGSGIDRSYTKMGESAQASAATQAAAAVTMAAAATKAFAAIVGAIDTGIKAMNRYQAALIGVNSVAKGQGISSAQMTQALDTVTDAFMDVASASTAFKNLLSRGYNIEQATNAIVQLKDAAAFGRQASLGLAQAVVTATEGLKNENSILVDNAGVTKNVSVMWREYAASIGTSVDKMTQAQKIEAEVIGLRHETRFQVGDLAKLQGTLAGRKVRDEVNTRTNVYCLGVCPSGQGKERAREVNKEILYLAGLDNLAGPEGLASHAGLVSAVETQPAILLQLDEIGRLLKTLGDASRSPHLYHVVTVLMKLYTSSGSIYLGDAYADTKRNKAIDQPNTCIWGTSVPKSLYEGLTYESVTDGFLSRMLVFEGDSEVPKQRPATSEIPKSLIDIAKWWGDFQPGQNLRAEHPQPHVVPITPEADQMLEGLDRWADQQAAMLGEPLGTLWTRTTEKARKLALIYACSANHELPAIDRDAAFWACSTSDYLTRRMIYLAHQWVAEGPFDAKRKRVLRVIQSAGPAGITRTMLCRRTRALQSRERIEIIDALVACGDVDVVSEETTGAPRVRYVAKD